MKPRMSSVGQVFAEKGNPLITDRERLAEFPLSLHRSADQGGLDDNAKTRARIRDQLKASLGVPTEKIQDFRPPQPAHYPMPDYDRYFAPKPVAKPLPIEKPISTTETDVIAGLRRAANHRQSALKLFKPKGGEISRPKVPHDSRLSPKTRPTGYSLYQRLSDGTETEQDLKSLTIAETLFRRRRKKRETVALELWSYDTGEMISCFKRKGT